MQVLVTGGAGYIGSVLIPMLLNRGYKVRCLDRFFFGKETLKDVASDPNLRLIKDDIRWFNPKILEGIDVVMDLAALKTWIEKGMRVVSYGSDISLLADTAAKAVEERLFMDGH